MKFRKISLNDKPLIDSIFSKFPPYCDFSFANLYNWRPGNKITQIALDGDNLIIKAADLITHKYEISILGENEIPEKIDALMNEFGHLSLVPEDVIRKYPNISEKFKIEEDLNNDDYIISTEKIISLEGKNYSDKRNEIRRFSKKYDYKIYVYDSPIHPKICNQILELYDLWLKRKSIKSNPNTDELRALKLLLAHQQFYNLAFVLTYIEESLVAFSISDLYENKYALCCFAKNNYDYEGSSEFLIYVTAKYLNDLGYKYISYEQDMGIKSLRTEKLSWLPDHLLRKFKISPKEK